MVLIADAGSTKCDWIFLSNDGGKYLKTRSEGLNPAVFKMELIKERILKNKDLLKNALSIEQIFFYGAGCGTDEPKQALRKTLESIFTNATVKVEEDMFGAVYAATTEPGIVCILGTGSNSCYFNGSTISSNTPSLGYILMDEASGNYFGKKLIRDYFYHKMPLETAAAFEKQFDLDPDTIKRNIYKEDSPNMYLASFAKFIFTNEMNEYTEKVIRKGIKSFFKNEIKPFEQASNVPIHFIGSIAYFSSKIIHDVAKKYNYTVGNIIQRPIDALVQYHQNLIFNKIK